MENPTKKVDLSGGVLRLANKFMRLTCMSGDTSSFSMGNTHRRTKERINGYITIHLKHLFYEKRVHYLFWFSVSIHFLIFYSDEMMGVAAGQV